MNRLYPKKGVADFQVTTSIEIGRYCFYAMNAAIGNIRQQGGKREGGIEDRSGEIERKRYKEDRREGGRERERTAGTVCAALPESRQGKHN